MNEELKIKPVFEAFPASETLTIEFQNEDEIWTCNGQRVMLRFAGSDMELLSIPIDMNVRLVNRAKFRLISSLEKESWLSIVKRSDLPEDSKENPYVTSFSVSKKDIVAAYLWVQDSE